VKVAVFWLLTVGVFSVACLPFVALVGWSGTWDWFGVGLVLTVFCMAVLSLWSLAEIRRDEHFGEEERRDLRRSIFFTRLGRFDFGVQPWLYLRDRVHGRNTRAWVEGDAVRPA
jgi:hypothetical protein